MLRGEILTEVGAVEAVAGEWDGLAVACGKPFCAPAWMLSWWRHAMPRGAELRVTTARASDGRLVAVAPFFAERRRTSGLVAYRVLGRGISYRVEPVGLVDRLGEAAAAVGATLARARPRPDLIEFEGVSEDCAWPEGIARAWPGRPAWSWTGKTIVAPTLGLRDVSSDEWFAARSRNFRQKMTRSGKQLVERDARVRMLAGDELEAGLRTFADLHEKRWADRGGSKVLSASVERMLRDAAFGLGEDRFRLWAIELDGREISAHVFVAAGGEVSYWLGGFDPEYGKYQPAHLTILAAIRHAWDAGDDRVDLGGGDQPYKRRFADGSERLRWVTLVPPGPRSGLARASVAGRKAYRFAVDRIPPQTKASMERSVRRLSRRSER